MKLVEVQGSGVLLKKRKFFVEITFYPHSWGDMTHGIEVRKNGKKAQVYTSGVLCNKTLGMLEAGGLQASEIWTVLRLITFLSYRTKRDRFYDYCNRNDIEGLLKSIYYSLFRQRYGAELRVEVRRLVKKLVQLGKIPKNNRWVTKHMMVEKKIFWRKVFQNETWN